MMDHLGRNKAVKDTTCGLKAEAGYAMKKRTLQRKGYAIKHTAAVGWWIDGAHGYLVTGYHSTEDQAVDDAVARIAKAKADGIKPSWMIN